MSEAVQMPLALAQPSELDRIFGRVVERVGLKESAGSLDCAPSYLANCIAGRNNNHVRSEWLEWAARQPGGESLGQYLSALAGYEVVPAAPLDPAERLAALERLVAPEVIALADANALAARRKP